MPAGWSNHEDELGTYILYPPGSPVGLSGDPSAITVVAHAMVPPGDCSQPVDTGQSAQAMADALVAEPGLLSSPVTPKSLGGLSGVATEVRLVAGWNKTCTPSPGGSVQTLHGLPPTSTPDSFDTGISAGTQSEIYLLDRPEGGVLGLEVDDTTGGGALPAMKSVAESVQFGAIAGGPTPTVEPTPAAMATPEGAARSRIAFVWTAPGSDVNNIATIASDGSDERDLTSSTTTMSEGVEWIPGSDRLLFDSDRSGCCHLFTMDGRGENVEPVGDPGGGYPSISPDGSTIAIDGGPPQGIWVINGDGTHPRRLTTAPAPAIDSLPAFSPDGKHIAFVRILDGTSGQGRSAIFVVGVNGKNLRQLTDFTTNASYPNWSPDGRHIVFNDNSANGSDTVPQNVWVMNRDGTHAAPLTNTMAGVNWAYGADWSPDGSQIVYVGVSTTARTLTVMNADGSNATAIWTAPDGEGIDDPDWGPAR